MANKTEFGNWIVARWDDDASLLKACVALGIVPPADKADRQNAIAAKLWEATTPNTLPDMDAVAPPPTPPVAPVAPVSPPPPAPTSSPAGGTPAPAEPTWQCPAPPCGGRRNQMSNPFCPGCGGLNPAIAAAVGGHTAPAPATPPSPTTPIAAVAPVQTAPCLNCGYPNPLDAATCQRCGVDPNAAPGTAAAHGATPTPVVPAPGIRVGGLVGWAIRKAHGG